MTRKTTTDNQPANRIAWDGAEFPVPADWEISSHDSDRGLVSLIIEDSAEVRAQLSWAPAADKRASARLRKLYDRFVASIEEALPSQRQLETSARGWSLRYCRADEGRSVVVGMRGAAASPVRVFLRLHALSDPGSHLERIARTLVDGFRFHERGAVPWCLYDLDIRVPREFRLVGTSLLAGRKLLIFENRLRRLWVWRFSLAGRMLRGRGAAEALADELCRNKDFPGVRFEADSAGGIVALRRRAHPFGHRFEIGRWCFRYVAGFEHLRGEDALLAYVFQYREAADLGMLQGLVLNG